MKDKRQVLRETVLAAINNLQLTAFNDFNEGRPLQSFTTFDAFTLGGLLGDLEWHFNLAQHVEAGLALDEVVQLVSRYEDAGKLVADVVEVQHVLKDYLQIA